MYFIGLQGMGSLDTLIKHTDGAIEENFEESQNLYHIEDRHNLSMMMSRVVI